MRGHREVAQDLIGDRTEEDDVGVASAEHEVAQDEQRNPDQELRRSERDVELLHEVQVLERREIRDAEDESARNPANIEVRTDVENAEDHGATHDAAHDALDQIHLRVASTAPNRRSRLS